MSAPSNTTQWNREQLIAKDAGVLDAAWMTLMQRLGLMMEVPEDHRKLALDMASTVWCSTSHLNASKLVLLFHTT